MTLSPGKRATRAKPKRTGSITQAEKEFVSKFVMDQPAEIAPVQVNALARVLRRSKEAVRSMVEEARENFVAGAGRYVEIHRQATEAALSNGDPKSLEVAARSAQWALTNISAEGSRIVDKASTESSGSKIYIGVKVGGHNPTTAVIEPSDK